MRTGGTGHYRGAIKARARAFRYAFAGIRFALAEPNFRIQLSVAAIVFIAAGILHVGAAQWVALILVSLAVLLMEMLNTVIEALVDLASPEHSPLAEKAKDIAAGAVLLASVAAVVVGVYVFLPHLARIAGLR